MIDSSATKLCCVFTIEQKTVGSYVGVALMNILWKSFIPALIKLFMTLSHIVSFGESIELKGYNSNTCYLMQVYIYICICIYAYVYMHIYIWIGSALAVF